MIPILITLQVTNLWDVRRYPMFETMIGEFDRLRAAKKAFSPYSPKANLGILLRAKVSNDLEPNF